MENDKVWIETWHRSEISPNHIVKYLNALNDIIQKYIEESEWNLNLLNIWLNNKGTNYPAFEMDWVNWQVLDGKHWTVMYNLEDKILKLGEVMWYSIPLTLHYNTKL